MSILKLARVHWHMGQTLLPEHLLAQEESAAAALQLRMSAVGLHSFGIISLGVSSQLLRDGVFAVTSLSALLSDGSVVDVPATCRVAPLSLSATGASRVSVYLHLLDDEYLGDDNPVYQTDPQVVRRVQFRAQLAVVDVLERTRGLLKLAEAEKGVDGTWSLSASYVPPLLRLSSTPFFEPELDRLQQGMTTLITHIEGQLQDTFLRPERLAVLRKTLAVLYKTQSLQADLHHHAPLHPYQLFSALRELYFELCCFHEAQPELRSLPYRHEALGGCFGSLLSQIALLCRPVYAHITHVRFAQANGLFCISQLPEELKLAQAVYLLIQRPHVHQRISLDEVKLSATSRLALVHRLILKGVTYQAVEQVTFRHPFGPEVDFYQLSMAEEWNHCIKESSLAFYAHPALERANAFLFWR